MEIRSFSEIISERQTSEIVSENESFIEYSVLTEKLSPILAELKQHKLMDASPIQKAVESLETELRRAKALTTRRGSSKPPSKKQVEDVAQGLGRSLGLVLFASRNVQLLSKEKIEALRREMMSVRFDWSPESEFVNDGETERTGETDQTGETSQTGETEGEIEEEIEEDGITLDVGDIVLRMKYGKDDEFKSALSAFSSMMRDNMIVSEWINEEGVIPILFNQLGTSKQNNRLTIIQTLRSLALQNDEHKVFYL